MTEEEQKRILRGLAMKLTTEEIKALPLSALKVIGEAVIDGAS